MILVLMTRGRPTCPKCGGNSTIPIVYGYPGPELREAWERDEVMLGGCCVVDNDPKWYCPKCYHQWD
jgi:hypothetical protein